MNRGVYDVIRGDQTDKETLSRQGHDQQVELALRLELEESLACWYELLFDPAESKARFNLITLLRKMQAKAAATPMARQHGHSNYSILNFLGYRTKTRFSVRKKPHFSLLGNDFIFYVELGRSRVCKKLKTTFVDAQSGSAVRPRIELEENFITIGFSGEDEERVSVYDFLRKCGLELQISTMLYAVEHHAQPVERWLDGGNRLLLQMLYQISNEEYDFFFFSNLFKLTLIQLDQQAYTKGGVAVLPDYVDNDSALQYRSDAIEKALNAYFQLPSPHLQSMQRTANTPSHMPNYSVQVLIEESVPHELYRFGSAKVQANDKHIFSCDIQGDEVDVSVLE